MISSWEMTKAKSNYHFDPTKHDQAESVYNYLGHIDNSWQNELTTIIETSKPATWATRGYKGEGIAPPSTDLQAEEYDLSRVGADVDSVITNLNWNIPACLKKISNDFALEDCMERIHVQWPGQLWNLHIDKLQKWCPENPERVMRIFIQLTDWQPGQFWEFGNHHWNQWRAGDVLTFDWQNMPHSTANSGHHPRVTLQLTGIATGKTYDYLANLAQ
jgi:hypothetical protein